MILAANDSAWGKLIELRLAIWLLKDARVKEYIELLRDSGSGIKKELASLEVDDPLTFLWRLLSETCFGMRSWWKSRSKEGSKEAFCVDMTQLIPVCIDRCLLSRPTRKVSRPVCVDGCVVTIQTISWREESRIYAACFSVSGVL